MATLQSGKCFTVPTFFGMCCRSEWQERMYIYKWHEVDQTKHEIFCVHIVCNEIQVKVNLEITTFFFLFAFSILSQLFLIWGCRSGSACVFYSGCNGFQVSLWFVTAVWLVQWMMGNAVQCDLWCESQYDGEDNIWWWVHGQDSWQHVCN